MLKMRQNVILSPSINSGRALSKESPLQRGTKGVVFIIYLLAFAICTLFTHFENRDKPITDSILDESGLQRYGYFYMIQLIPEEVPNRVKIGYTDNLETRLREHQTSAPTAKFLGHWKCKRSWDQAAMDSITRDNCQLVMNEVYEGNLKGFVNRAKAACFLFNLYFETQIQKLRAFPT